MQPRNNPDGLVGDSRGNLVLGIVIIIAALLIIVALGLTTGVPDTSSPSGDGLSRHLTEEMIEQLNLAFNERTDSTNDTGQTWNFTPLHKNSTVDFERLEDRLEAQGLTREQQFRVLSLVDDVLARGDSTGDITRLESLPWTNRSTGAVLIRNDSWTSLDRNITTLETPDGVQQDTILAIEANSLPVGKSNAFIASVDGVTVEAWRGTGDPTDLYYRVENANGTNVTDGTVVESGTTELVVNIPADTLNGAPVSSYGGSATEFITGRDLGASPSTQFRFNDSGSDRGYNPTRIALSTVLANATATGSVPPYTTNLSSAISRMDVLATAVFDLTHVDPHADGTSITSKDIRIDATYRAFDSPDGENLKPVLTGVAMNIETEDPSELDLSSGGAGTATVDTPDVGRLQNPVPPGNIWLPNYTQEDINYTIEVLATYSDGTTASLTPNATITAYNVTAQGATKCALGSPGNGTGTDRCLARLPGPNETVVPQVLSDQVMIEATVTPGAPPNGTLPGPTTITENVTVLDPYIDSYFSLEAPEAAIGDSVGTGFHVLEPRKQASHVGDTVIPVNETSSLQSLGAVNVVTELPDRFNIDASDQPLLTTAMGRITKLNHTEQTVTFPNATPSERAALVGFDGADQSTVADFFEWFNVPHETFTLEDVMSASAERAGAIGTLFPPAGSPDEFAHLAAIGSGIDGALDQGQLVQDTLLFQLHDRIGSGIGNTPVDSEIAVLVDELTAYDPTAPSAADMMWSVTQFINYLDVYEQQLQSRITSGSYTGVFNKSVNRSLIESITSQQIVPILQTDDLGGQIPANFTALVGEFYAEANGYTNSTYRSHNIDTFGNYNDYLLFGGIVDTGDRTALGELMSEIANRTLDATPQQLVAAAQYRVLDESAVGPQGTYGLGSRPPLRADWDVALESRYTEYDFANYTGSDTIRVSQINPASVARINVLINYDSGMKQAIDSGAFNSVNLDSPYPLETGTETPITTLVQYDNGQTELNPTGVNYNLAGPTYNPADSNYTGPASPSDFASINTTGEPTITAHHPTGRYYNNGTTPATTGPIVLEASVGSKVAQTKTSAVNFDAEGVLAWGTRAGSSQTTLFLDTSPNVSTYVGVSYTLTHGTGTAAWRATNRSMVQGKFGTMILENNSVATFTRAQMVLEAQAESNGTLEATATDIEESAALDLDLIDQALFNATGNYTVVCPTCGGTPPAGDPYTGNPMMMMAGAVDKEGIAPYPAPAAGDGSFEISYSNGNGGTVVNIPKASVWRGPVPMNTTVAAGDSDDLYAWANYEAYLVATTSKHYLAEGEVSWRSNGCQSDNYNCIGKPIAMVDSVGTTDEPWTSSLSDTFGSQVNVNATKKTGGAGMDGWNLTYKSSTTSDLTGSVEVTGSHSQAPDVGPDILDVTVTAEDDPDDKSGNPGDFQIVSLNAPSDVREGTEYTVAAEILNDGQTATQNIVLSWSGGQQQSQNLNITGGKIKQVAFDLNAPYDPGGTVSHTIQTDNDSQTVETDITVSAGDFQIVAVDAPGTVETGENYEIEVDIKNTANESTQDVTLAWGKDNKSFDIIIPSSDTRSLAFGLEAPYVIGPQPHTITTQNDSQTVSVEYIPSAALAMTVADRPAREPPLRAPHSAVHRSHQKKHVGPSDI